MGPGKKTSQKPNWSTGQVSKSMEIFIDAVNIKVNVKVITYCYCCWSNVMLLYNCRDQTQYNVPALASSVWSGKIDPSHSALESYHATAIAVGQM